MFRITIEFGRDDRGKQDVVPTKPIQDLVGIKAELRAQRFNALQQQIESCLRTQVERHNTQENAALYLALNSDATKSGSEFIISASANAPCELIIKFKPGQSEVRIKSTAFNYTIEVWNIEPASTGLVYRQKGARSWAVLEDTGVEQMVERAFKATFGF